MYLKRAIPFFSCIVGIFFCLLECCNFLFFSIFLLVFLFMPDQFPGWTETCYPFSLPDIDCYCSEVYSLLSLILSCKVLTERLFLNGGLVIVSQDFTCLLLPC
jgi:hypothetical protein